MSSSPSAVPIPSAEAHPVEGGERLILLDALRGFALCGVFVSNAFMWFSGRAYMPRDQFEALSTSLPDTVVRYAAMILVFGKFITIFSFLFGLGFAVQMGRAEQRGASVTPLYARRLGVLLAIGLAHCFLLWHGDILSTYALLGFGLLLFRNRLDKTLLLWVALFIFLVPLALQVYQSLPQLLGSPEARDAAKAEMERAKALSSQMFAGLSGGSYFAAVKANATFYLKGFIRVAALSLPVIFGRFLLGLMAGRRKLFHEPSQHLPLFRKVLVWGLVAGALCSGAGFTVQLLITRKVLVPENMPWLPLVMAPVQQVAELGLASFYVASFTLLFQRRVWQRLLSVLAPVGRMALSNYLLQTVLNVFLYYGYGLGLIGKLRPVLCVALTLGTFSVQLLLSHLWLARFRFGPVEWVWRSLTYGKAQPMRRTPTATGTEREA